MAPIRPASPWFKYRWSISSASTCGIVAAIAATRRYRLRSSEWLDSPSPKVPVCCQTNAIHKITGAYATTRNVAPNPLLPCNTAMINTVAGHSRVIGRIKVAIANSKALISTGPMVSLRIDSQTSHVEITRRGMSNASVDSWCGNTSEWGSTRYSPSETACDFGDIPRSRASLTTPSPEANISST